MARKRSRPDLARLMMPTWRALLEIETACSVDHGVDHWHYIVLADVQDHPGTSQKDVSERIVRSPSRLVTDVDQLCARGLLARSAPPHDRRIHRLTLTAAGRTLTSTIRRAIHAREDRLLHRLTPEERRELRDLLERALDPDVV